ncbi:MAG: PAS domain-containing sensor histidine kinase [Candidatus Paceibacterota bacterium]
MKKSNGSFLKDFIHYWHTPEILSLLVMLGLMGGLFAYGAYYTPLFLTITAFVVFFGIVIILIRSFVSFARMNAEEQFVIRERNALIQYLKDGVIIYDTNFKIKTFNRAAEQIFHVSTEEVVGKQIDPSMVKTSHFRVLTQTLFPSLAPSVSQLSETNIWPQVVNLSFEEPKQELHTTLNPLVNEQGEVEWFIKIVRDTTREKNVLQTKSDFINVAAHQLRTPLTALHWALENIVKFSEGTPDVHSVAIEALGVSERSLKITNDLLDVSKIEEGKFGYTFTSVPITPFVESITKEMKTLADQYSITLSLTPPQEQFPDIYLDQNRISAVLFNLIDNAIRYNTKNGKVTLSITREEAKPFIRISIADTGVGIPPDEINKLFQKLHRGSNVVQLEPNGSGLGLYIAKNIVLRHGGELGVSSELNRGSTFWITLPLDASLVPQREIADNMLAF